MRLVLAAAALLSLPLAATPAAAQRSGAYVVAGQSADGTKYEGSAQFVATGPATWRITWRIAGDTTNGVGLVIGSMLVVGYTSGRDTGAAGYEIAADGQLTGSWTAGREGGVGIEVMLPR